MHLVRVDEEARALFLDHQTEMVGHRLVQVEARGPAKGRREIETFLPVSDIPARHRVQWRTHLRPSRWAFLSV